MIPPAMILSPRYIATADGPTEVLPSPKLSLDAAGNIQFQPNPVTILESADVTVKAFYVRENPNLFSPPLTGGAGRRVKSKSVFWIIGFI